MLAIALPQEGEVEEIGSDADGRRFKTGKKQSKKG